MNRLWAPINRLAALRSGLEIVLIAALGYAALVAIARLTARFERHLAARPTPDAIEHGKRARTLAGLIGNVARVFVLSASGLMILDKLDINIAPILAGAGIVGLAVGFGAQTLVKDVISGFFIILENQIRVGDAAEINGVHGIVETIHLRTISMRDLQGAVHVMPCGSIASISNMTRDFAYALVDAIVSHRNNPDRVLEIARHVGAELAGDDEWADAILGAAEVLGVEALNESSFTIRMRLRTVPHRQWEVGRELRRRLKLAFDQSGIELSAPGAFTAKPPAPAPPSAR